MTEETEERKANLEQLPLSAIFLPEGVVRPEYRSAVVKRVIERFPNLPNSARSALRSAVNDAKIPLPGFRPGQSGRALGGPNAMLLLEPIDLEMRLTDRLASAVLRGWAESHSDLRKEVTRYLDDKGLETNGMDFAENRFRALWLPKQWETEWEIFTQANSQFDRDDIGLMLCYVSGKFPFLDLGEKREEPEVLAAALSYLRELPPTSPEWGQEIPDFISSISKLIEVKAAQRRWVVEFEIAVQNIRKDFPELLEFFEQDTEQWAAAKIPPEADTAETFKLVEKLQSLLAEYQPIHERATGISEERERSQKRDELQPVILDTLNQIDALMAEKADREGRDSPEGPKPDGPTTQGDSPPGEDAPEAQEPGPPPAPPPPLAEPEPEPSRANPQQEASPVAESDVQGRAVAVAEPPGMAPEEYAALQSENRGLRNDSEALRAENRGLRNDSEALRAENQGLRQEVEVLKTELFDSQEREESWRMAYRSAMDGSLEDADDALADVENVNAAVEMAKSRFRQELLFAPNSESNIEGNPFNDPQKVWEALRWLATTYYSSRMGRLRVTDFDQSVKEACGWWYKGDQGETTLSRYEKSYTTRVDGKRHWLAEHIGKGTTFDARYTIRIAFDWDREKRQVIVGYIGRHQQTDAS